MVRHVGQLLSGALEGPSLDLTESFADGLEEDDENKAVEVTSGGDEVGDA